MFAGDSLAVVLFLASVVIACVIGALSAPTPSHSRAIGGLGAAFLLILVAWIVLPNALPFVKGLRPPVEALVASGAPVIVVTVGIVALMLGRRDGSGCEDADSFQLAPPESVELDTAKPSFVEYDAELSKWLPDMSFLDGFVHIGDRSTWADARSRLTVDAITGEIQDALCSGKLTAWGKAHPDDERHWQIKKLCWDLVELNPKSNLAFFPRQNATSYDLMLSRGQLCAAYPAAAERG